MWHVMGNTLKSVLGSRDWWSVLWTLCIPREKELLMNVYSLQERSKMWEFEIVCKGINMLLIDTVCRITEELLCNVISSQQETLMSRITKDGTQLSSRNVWVRYKICCKYRPEFLELCHAIQTFVCSGGQAIFFIIFPSCYILIIISV